MPKLHKNKNTASANTLISMISLLIAPSMGILCLAALFPAAEALREEPALDAVLFPGLLLLFCPDAIPFMPPL